MFIFEALESLSKFDFVALMVAAAVFIVVSHSVFNIIGIINDAKHPDMRFHRRRNPNPYYFRVMAAMFGVCFVGAIDIGLHIGYFRGVYPFLAYPFFEFLVFLGTVAIGAIVSFGIVMVAKAVARRHGLGSMAQIHYINGDNRRTRRSTGR
ncbi:hypothetical protein H0X09_00840 [Candidatus Saccharibacteria bacterium]|nr:hypothetical protein [Candidatus Saccharibacteria bacterium]